MEWNDNFDLKKIINGKTIIVGKQDFSNGTVKVKEEDGTIIDCKMQLDENGDVFFIYCGWGVYISDYLFDFKIEGE